MTIRNEREQRLREWKIALQTRLARRVMTTRTTGLDGFAKRLLDRQLGGEVAADPELDHPDEWDRPID